MRRDIILLEVYYKYRLRKYRAPGVEHSLFTTLCGWVSVKGLGQCEGLSRWDGYKCG